MCSTVISSIIFQFSPPVINFAIINFTMWYNHLIHCCSSYSYKFLLNIFIRNKMKKVLFLISPYYLSCVLPFFIKFQVSDLYNFLLSEELVLTCLACNKFEGMCWLQNSRFLASFFLLHSTYFTSLSSGMHVF